MLTCVHELGIREGRSLSLQSLLAWRAKAAISANSEVGSQQLSDGERDPVTGRGNPKTRLELSPPVPPDGVGGREVEELLVGRAGQGRKGHIRIRQGLYSPSWEDSSQTLALPTLQDT